MMVSVNTGRVSRKIDAWALVLFGMLGEDPSGFFYTVIEEEKSSGLPKTDHEGASKDDPSETSFWVVVICCPWAILCQSSVPNRLLLATCVLRSQAFNISLGNADFVLTFSRSWFFLGERCHILCYLVCLLRRVGNKDEKEQKE